MKHSQACTLNAMQDPVLNAGGLVAGLDEAGRGPLAGPVVAGCVLLDSSTQIQDLNDSKALSARKRSELLVEILDQAPAVGLGVVSPARIDRINIYQASRQAMLEAYEDMGMRPGLVLSDAMPLQIEGVEVRDLIKGDTRESAIMAASVVAKQTRDQRMLELHERYPEYGFHRHKGYPTPEHLECLRELGPCPEHRLSFRPVLEVCLSRSEWLRRALEALRAHEVIRLAEKMKLAKLLEPHREVLFGSHPWMV